MTGGLIQLVTQGIDDIFLTGDPEITLFKSIYRRHSNFSKTEERLFFNNKLTFGGTATCRIKRNADYVNKIYLVIELPQVIAKYEPLTLNKINSILNNVGIYYPFDNSFTDDQIITKDYYNTQIKPYIENQIDLFYDIVQLATQEYETIELVNKEKSFDLRKFVDVEIPYELIQPNRLCNYLPDKYKFFSKIIKIHSTLHRNTKLIYELYDFLTSLYETIDTKNIKLYDAISVKNIIYNTALKFLFHTKDNHIHHIGDNLLFYNAITNNIQTNSIQIDTLIDNNTLSNLDFNLIHQKCISYCFQISDKKILIDWLLNNLSQLLQFIKGIKLGNHFGFVYFNNCLIDNYNCNNFFIYDGNTNINSINFYQNFVREKTRSFFGNLSSLFKTSKFIPYYQDTNYWIELEISSQKLQMDSCLINILEDLYNIFKENGKFWTCNFSSNKCISVLEQIKYSELLTQIKYIEYENYEYDSYILYYVPNKYISCKSNKFNVITSEKKEYFEMIYYPNKIPEILSVLDILLITIANDVLNVIDESNIPDDLLFCTKQNAMRLLHLYVLTFDEIPVYNSSLNYNSILKTNSYIQCYNYITKYESLVNDYLIRISSIWNYITQQQMILYNSFINELLNPINYSFGNNFCIGYTIRYAYDLFIKLLNKNDINFNDINFNNIQINDIIDEYEYAINEIINEINNVLLNSEKNKNILEVRNINPSLSNIHNSLLKMMTSGLERINFEFIGTDLFINNVKLKNNEDQGYVIQILNNEKIREMPIEFVQLFLGECFKTLGIVPFPTNSISSIQNFSCYNDAFLSICNEKSKDDQKFMGISDFIEHIQYLILENKGTNDLQMFQDLILDIFEYNESPFVTIQNDLSVYDIKESFLSIPQIKIYDNSIDLSDVTNVIKYILDLIINKLQKISVFNFENITNINEYNQYIKSVKSTYSNYIKQLTLNYLYEGSYISNRINSLLSNDFGLKNAEFAWSKYIGFNLIEEINVKIGDQIIDKHDYNWLYIDHVINRSISKDYGFNNMIGNIPELYNYNSKVKPAHMLYIPLQFWFCKYVNESLPLLSMNYTDIDITVSIKSLEKVAYWSEDSTLICNQNLSNCHLLTDYIYIDQEDRKLLAKSKFEYLIEYVQKDEHIINAKNINNNTVNIIIKLNNICKFMVWFFQIEHENQSVRDKIINWNDKNYKIYKNPIEGFEIRFNDLERESMKYNGYYNYVQPYEKLMSSLPDNFYMYSFALYPNFLQPSGGSNMDMLGEYSIVVKLSNEIVNDIRNGKVKLNFNIYGKEYTVLRIIHGLTGLTFFNE